MEGEEEDDDGEEEEEEEEEVGALVAFSEVRFTLPLDCVIPSLPPPLVTPLPLIFSFTSSALNDRVGAFRSLRVVFTASAPNCSLIFNFSTCKRFFGGGSKGRPVEGANVEKWKLSQIYLLALIYLTSRDEEINEETERHSPFTL